MERELRALRVRLGVHKRHRKILATAARLRTLRTPMAWLLRGRKNLIKIT